MLVGCEHELRALTARIDAAGQGGGAIVMRGEPGVGKSFLLEAAKRHAGRRGCRVLATAGLQSESHLPLAALHHLLLPILGEVERLPPFQRDALRAAFGLAEESVPGTFPLALATLHLLGEIAAQSPILVVVDDAQWLDRSTADVLSFLARRLDADPVVLLLAIRDGSESVLLETVLPVLTVGGLAAAEAAALLDACAPDLTPTLRERVLRDSAGNPLALVELPIALRFAGVTEATLPVPWLPLTARLEQMFAARLSKLPATARTLLLVASADENADLADLLRAASEVEGRQVTVDDVSAAVSEGLVEIHGPLAPGRKVASRSARSLKRSRDDAGIQTIAEHEAPPHLRGYPVPYAAWGSAPAPSSSPQGRLSDRWWVRLRETAAGHRPPHRLRTPAARLARGGAPGQAFRSGELVSCARERASRAKRHPRRQPWRVT